MLCSKISTLLPAGDIAFRVNIFSCVCGALLFIAVYFLSVEFIRSVFNTDGTEAAFLSLAAAMFLCFSTVFWSESSHAKGGIRMLAYAATAACACFAMRHRLFGYKKDAFMAAFLAGFLQSLHQTTVAAMVIVLFSVFYRNKKLSFSDLTVCFNLFLISFLTPVLYIFIRMAADPAVHWSGISTYAEAFGYISRKVYSAHDPGPMTPASIVFKLSTALKLVLLAVNIMIIPSIPGLYLLYKKKEAVFWTVIIFFVANTVAVAFFTADSFSPVFVYVNKGFYILSCAAFILPAAVGLFWFYGIIGKKPGVIFVFALMLLPVFPFAVNYQANDSSRRFLGYDHPMNIYKTLAPGDRLLCASDTPVFNILYMKQIAGYFRNMDVYDLNANLFDLRPYASDRTDMSEKKLHEINSETAYAPGARVFCTEFTSYPEKAIFPSLYGIIYRLSGDKKAVPATSRWLEICTIRDYYNSKNLDIAYRGLLSRYFITGAEYAALKGDRLGFENLRAMAERTCPEDPGIMATIASSYFFYMNDIQRSIKYLERAVDIDPYYTASIRLLVKLYSMEGDLDSAKKWAGAYIEREKDRNNIAEFRAQDGIYLLQK